MDERFFEFINEFFGGGSLDWRKLFNYMDDFELEPSDLIHDVRSFTSDPTFNDLMYSCLYLGSEKMKNVLIDYAKDKCCNFDEVKEAIENYEVGIYCNYVDSGFDDNIFRYFTYKELDDENNIKEMLFSILNAQGVKCDSENC